MPNNYAKIEPLSAILRVYDEKRDDSVHNTGIPFSFALTVRWLNPDSVELMGLHTRMNLSAWKAIRDECVANGIFHVLITKYKNGKKVEKWLHFKKGLKLEIKS